MARRARRKSRTLGCLVWLVMVLAVAVAFVILRPTLTRAVQTSGLADLFPGRPSPDSTEGAGSLTTGDTAPAQEPTQEPTVVVDGATERPAESTAERPAESTAERPAESTAERPAESTAEPPGGETPVAIGRSPQEAAPGGPPSQGAGRTPARSKRTSVLYFVRQDDTGVSIEGIPREVTYTDAPLTETLAALLAGPTPTERSRGYLSLIPEGTRVESVEVRGQTAYLSFDERFRLNPYGRDGLEAQLKQVVWTATEFGSVRSVQILIGGKVAEYLGPEGLRIRDPLSRDSLGDP